MKLEDITIKKSTFNRILFLLVSSLTLSAFFGGYILGEKNAKNTIEENVANQTIPTSPIIENSKTFVSSGSNPFKGNVNTPITIVEFSDFQCPFCEKFFDQTLPQIQQDYIDSGKVKLAFRNFPLSSIHKNAFLASVSAQCANEQGQFWKYHDKLFQTQIEWAGLDSKDVADKFKQYALTLGLNSNVFDMCLDSGKYSDRINKDLQDGTNYGVTGTPTFFIGDDKNGYTKLVGAQPYSEFQKILGK